MGTEKVIVVLKFSQDGKVLMTLGKAGVTGDGAGPRSISRTRWRSRRMETYLYPTGMIAGRGNARVMKFTKDGKFIKQWGGHGSGPGQFEVPHTLAFDSQGRLFVGDRANNRIQIFDQDGKFIAEWKQFGRPSGIFIDSHDVIYVGRFGIDRDRRLRGQQSWIQTRHPDRQRERWNGDGVYSG